jgi:hypothetical protein
MPRDLVSVVVGDRNAIWPPWQMALMQAHPRPNRLLRWTRHLFPILPAADGP